MEAKDLKVIMRMPCDRCAGSGRVVADAITFGDFSTDNTKPCPECAEKGYFERPVPLPEFKRVLEQI
jgi:DnaJ-class molecular chaperone